MNDATNDVEFYEGLKNLLKKHERQIETLFTILFSYFEKNDSDFKNFLESKTEKQPETETSQAIGFKPTFNNLKK